MNNDSSITHIENFCKKRKELLSRTDLETMQKEFFDNKEKSSVKIKKNDETTNKSNVNDFTVKTIETKKIKGKKKIKDVVTLDIPLSETVSKSKVTTSLFSQNFKKEVHSLNLQTIDKESGLPQVFKIKEEHNNLNIQKETTVVKQNKKDEVEIQQELKEQKEDDEYNKINEENLEKIKKMTKEEIEKAQKEILTSIPSSLIEKMKKGIFSIKIKKSSEHKKKETKIHQSTNQNKDTSQKTTSEEIILYDYNGNTKIQKVSDENKDDLSTLSKNKIDFSKLTFNEMDIKNKYFSLAELYNLLSSSNPIQITLSLKILFNLLSKRLYESSNDFQIQLYSFINAFYFLIDHSNINVSLFALKNFLIILQNFFYDDYQKFSFLICNISIFQAFPINNTFFNLSKHLYETKLKLIEMIKQNNKNYIQLIIHSSNEEIKNLYKETLFYICYITNSIPGDLFKNIATINQEIQIEKKQKLCKLLLLISPNDNDFNIITKYIKNKHYCNFICALRGISINQHKEEVITLKDKLYNLNYILLHNNNTNIPISTYIHENDFSYLSKVLLCKLKYALNTVNSADGDEISPMFTNETQINFFTNKFNEAISKLSSIDFSNYFEIIPLYYYLNVFLLFWHKAFKYPKIILYKNIGVSLDEIIALYPMLNSHLTSILNNCYLTKSKTEKREMLYQYQIFLVLNINYIKCFIKNHDSKYNIKGFPLYLIKLSELINKGDEYYYFVYTKFIKNILLRKFNEIKNIEKDIINFDIELFYKEIDADLNFYLDSNEDYRKSIMDKKIFMFSDKNNHTIPIAIYNEQTNSNKSKYFPFEQNFIFQILYNDKAQSSIKVSYLIILFFLWYGEDYLNTNNKTQEKVTITPFEICLRSILNTKLSEFITNKKLSFYFELFLKKIVLNTKEKNNMFNLQLSDTLSNKLLLENVFTLYEEVLNYEQRSFLLKLIVLFLLFIHNNNACNDMLNPKKYSKNIEQIIYENIHFLTTYNIFLDGVDNNMIITTLVNNINISNASLYQTLILCFIRISDDQLEPNKENMLVLFIYKLMEYFNIQTNDYSIFKSNNELLLNNIINKLKTN